MTDFVLDKIEKQPTTLRDVVLDRLRGAIIEGVFQPGDRLIERVLCEQLGVSRTVVRETLRYLDAEGLVEHIPNKGPIVAPMTWDDARQIYDIRRKLETSAAMSCADNMTPDLKTRLQSALAELDKAVPERSSGAIFKATTRFYQAIFEGAGHNIAWEVVQRLNGRISRLRIMTVSSDARETSGPAHMHEICDAIIARDPQAALRAVESHLDDAIAVAKSLLASEAAS